MAGNEQEKTGNTGLTWTGTVGPARAGLPRALSSGDEADDCRGTCSEFLMSFMTSALGKGLPRLL
jgi:hypothetical protein